MAALIKGSSSLGQASQRRNSSSLLSPAACLAPLRMTPVLGKGETRGARQLYRLSANRPISNSKNRPEFTSTATLVLGTNLSRSTGDILALARVGADPRIGILKVACFCAAGLRRKSPAMGL